MLQNLDGGTPPTETKGTVTDQEKMVQKVKDSNHHLRIQGKMKIIVIVLSRTGFLQRNKIVIIRNLYIMFQVILYIRVKCRFQNSTLTSHHKRCVPIPILYFVVVCILSSMQYFRYTLHTFDLRFVNKDCSKQSFCTYHPVLLFHCYFQLIIIL